MTTRSLLISALLMTTSLRADEPWQKKMSELSDTLSAVMPDLVSQKPVTPKSLERLTKAAKKITEVAHQIKMGAQGKAAPPPDADPSISLLSSLFAREAQNAYHALKSGSPEFGKASLRAVTSYCISCHTRTDQGPSFPSLPLKTDVGKLNRMERAQLFAATRQFDKALEEFEGVISDPAIAAKRQLEWGRAVRHAFAIAIRVNQSPDRALKIVQKVESLPATPKLFQDFIGEWKKSILDWKKEGAKKFDSEEALFKEAQRLSVAAEATQKYPMDHSGDVLFLRLTLVAHELLTRYPEGKYSADVLLMLGNAYDVLDDHLMSPLPEMYYETCIRRSPHTSIAQKCFQRYESNIFFGYTGSGGTSIPTEVENIMKELRDLAKVKKS